MDNNAAYTWKLLLKARNCSHGLMSSRIHDGADPNMWLDPLVDGWSLVEILREDYMHTVGGPQQKGFHSHISW